MTEKKVVLFIVEGPSDESALGTIMKEYFSGNNVQFVVVHGDITSGAYTSADTILKKINEQVEIVKKKYRYRQKDFLRIIHITDTDGAFVQDNDIYETDTVSVRYYEDHIEAPDRDKVIIRNGRKREILYKLRKTGKVHAIPYSIYFNSCNLEHVLYGELREFSDEEKQQLSDAFAEQYEGRADKFVEFISSPEVAVPGIYQKTWDYIEKAGNSLNRHSNMHLIFLKGGFRSENRGDLSAF